MKKLVATLILPVFAVTSFAGIFSDISDLLNSDTPPEQTLSSQSGDLISAKDTDSEKTKMEKKNEKLRIMVNNKQLGNSFFKLLDSPEGQDENWRLSKGDVGTWIPMTRTTSDYTKPMVVYSVERIQFVDIPNQPIGNNELSGFWPSIPSHNYVKFMAKRRVGVDLIPDDINKRGVISDCSLTNSYGGHPSVSAKNNPLTGLLGYEVMMDSSSLEDFGFSREVTDIACYYAYGVTPPKISKMPEFVRGLSVADHLPQDLQLSNKIRAQFMDESHKHAVFYWSTENNGKFVDQYKMHVFMIDCETQIFIGGYILYENGKVVWREVPPTMEHPSDETFKATCAAATLPITLTIKNSYDTSTPRGVKNFDFP